MRSRSITSKVAIHFCRVSCILIFFFIHASVWLVFARYWAFYLFALKHSLFHIWDISSLFPCDENNSGFIVSLFHSVVIVSLYSLVSCLCFVRSFILGINIV